MCCAQKRMENKFDDDIIVDMVNYIIIQLAKSKKNCQTNKPIIE